MSEVRKVVVYGGRAYTAAEMLRLLVTHPQLELGALVSKGAAGESVGKLHPHVERWYSSQTAIDEEAAMTLLEADSDAVIALCLGSGESAATVAALGDAGKLEDRILVDLSGDFRLDSGEDYQRWYGEAHKAPQWLGRFEYCIPELHRENCQAQLISNPGCFATAVQLAVEPALRSGYVEEDVRVFAVTGSSGSGGIAKANTHHPSRAHEFYAYKALEHQHLPEIFKGLGLQEDFALSLVTHSAPLVRGISVSAMMRLKDPEFGNSVKQLYRSFVDSEPMLDWSGEAPPKLAGIIGTNQARLGVAINSNQLVAFCAIDNLCRGASGQAIQNINRALGWEETLGLDAPGMLPA